MRKKSKPIGASNGGDELMESNIQEKEIDIPADGKCLYTTVFVGYLIIVINDIPEFKKRLTQLIGNINENDIEEIRITLYQGMKDVNYLKSNLIKNLVQEFKDEIGFSENTWGGIEEVQAISNALDISIQEMLPNTSGTKEKYTKGKLINAEISENNLTETPIIKVLSCHANSKEISESSDDFQIKKAKENSIKSAENYQHYRLILEDDEDLELHNNLEKISTNKISCLSSKNNDDRYPGYGLKNTTHGDLYQSKILMLVLHRSLKKRFKFRLGTEVDAAEKFDDVVLEFEQGGTICYRLLQAKHYQNEKEIITFNNLTASEKSKDQKDKNFGLKKYFRSFLNVKKSTNNAISPFKKGEIKDVIIYTNIGFDLKEPKLSNSFEPVKGMDPIFFIKEDIKIYKINNQEGSLLKESLMPILEECSDIHELAKELASAFDDPSKKLDLKNKIFEKYHYALKSEILDKERKKISKKTEKHFIKLKKEFVDGNNLSPEAKKFRDHFKKLYDLKKGGEVEVSKTFLEKDKNKDCSEELPKDETASLEDIQDFLDKVLFAVNQPNEKELTVVLQEKLGKEYKLLDHVVYEKFEHEMLNWFSQKQGIFINEETSKEFFEEIKRQLHSLYLTGLRTDFKRYIDNFGIQFKTPLALNDFLRNTKSNFLIIKSMGSVFFTGIKIHQAIQELKAYARHDSYIFLNILSTENLEDYVIPAFENKAANHILILQCDKLTEKNTRFIKQCREKILDNNQNKKLILIVSNSIVLQKYFSEGLYQELDDHEANFNDMTESTQNRLTNQEVFFSGKSVFLKDLISEDGLQKHFSTNSLTELLESKDEIIVAEKPTFLNQFEEECYVPRILKGETVLKEDWVKITQNFEDIFIIDVKNHSKFLQNILNIYSIKYELIKYSHFKHSSHISDKKFIILDGNEKDCIEAFNQLSKELTGINLHWIEFNEKGKKYFWVRTHGSVDNLRNYLDKEWYLPREENKINHLNKIEIIADEPGMGKSNLLLKYAEHHFNHYKNIWIIHIDLNKKRKLLPTINTNSVVEVLIELGNLPKKSITFDVLRYQLVITDKVAIFFDGFDEIDGVGKEKIIQLLTTLKNYNAKLIITTRPQYQRLLEEKLSVFSYNIKPFERKEQINFFVKFFKFYCQKKNILSVEEEKIKIFSNSLINNMNSALKNKLKNNKFIGVPLQVRMLAELFKDEFYKYYLSKEEPNFFIDFENIFELFNQFYEKKIEIYFMEKRKISHSINNPAIKLMFFEAHCFIASELLFPGFVKRTNLALCCNKEELQAIGLVYELDGKSSFWHKTYGEFIFAKFIIMQLNDSEISEKKLNKLMNFLQINIFRKQADVIRFFIDECKDQNQYKILAERWGKFLTQTRLVIKHTNRLKSQLLNPEEETTHNNEQKMEMVDEKRKAEEEDDFPNLVEEILSIDPNDVHWGTDKNFFDKLLEQFKKQNDLMLLGKCLRNLAFIGKETKFNKLREYILFNCAGLVWYYARRELENNNTINNSKNLLEKFKEIQPFSSYNPYSCIVESSVKSENKRIANLYKAFEKADKLISENQEVTLELVQNIDQGVICFLKLRKHIFNTQQLKQLLLTCQNHPNKSDIYLLFYQVDAKIDGNIVVDFLLEEESFQDALRFLSVYKLEPSEQQIQKLKQAAWNKLDLLYLLPKKIQWKNSEFNQLFLSNNYESLLWLEKQGASIIKHLMQLTPEVSDFFTAIYQTKRITGWEEKYLTNIWYHLILELLEKMVIKKGHHIDIPAFLKLVYESLHFSFRVKDSLPLNINQFNHLMKMIELSLNTVNLDSLCSGVICLSYIAINWQLTVFDVGNGLLIRSESEDFELEINLKYKDEIFKWLRWYLAQGNKAEAKEKLLEDIKLIVFNDFISNKNTSAKLLLQFGILNNKKRNHDQANNGSKKEDGSVLKKSYSFN